MALFISFEGGEGSGKSTQASRLTQALDELGVPNLFIHEPGTTLLGNHIRHLIKGNPWGSKETISTGAELFLFSAARAELVSKAIAPEMDRNRLVIVADRYVDSTVAYQGYGRRMPLELIASVNELACQGIMPDLTFLLDCDPAEGLKRVGSVQTLMFETGSAGRMDEEGSRRFEEEPMAFHKRVRRGYHQLAKDEPDRWVVLDAMEPEDAIFERVWQAVQCMGKFERMTEGDSQISLLASDAADRGLWSEPAPAELAQSD